MVLIDDKKKDLLRQGVSAFEPWLLAILREGIADLPEQPASFWQEAAARLVDIGASGAANLLREIPKFYLTERNWQSPTLRRLGELYVWVQAIKNIDALPEAVQAEALLTAGVTVQAKKMLENATGDYASVVDTWQVLGEKQGKTTDDALLFRRVWLRGKINGLYALLLDFDFGGRGYSNAYVVGSEWQGELVFYPGNAGLRAHVKTRQDPPFAAIKTVEALPDFASFQPELTTLTAAAFWLQIAPCLLENVLPYRDKTPPKKAQTLAEPLFYLLDAHQTQIPMACEERLFWKLVAANQGRPLTLFGEWQFDRFEPLAAFAAETWISLR